MMRALVALCVRHFGAVTALTLLALVLGVWGALQAPLDVFPEFVPSQVDIQTEAPGFAPQQVEELVTKQVENAVNGSAGTRDDAFGVHSGTVGGHHHLRRRRRCARRASGHFGALVRARQHASRRRRARRNCRRWSRARWIC